ncbi:MAG: hypothetical protein ACREOE_16485 [Gemmatimonadales bacterium]
MSDVPGSSADAGEERELLARLRAVIGAKDTEIAVLREQCRRLELKVAEAGAPPGVRESTTCGVPPSKDPIGARERRKAERQSSERERREDRKRGGQPWHPCAGLSAGPGPG